MNPNSNNEAIQLPPVEQAPSSDSAEKAAQNVETAALAERVTTAPAAMPTSIPLPTPPAMPQAPQPVAGAATNQGNPAQASDDTDIIEKEWVDKAKQIVERTRDDPYKQSEELTVFKADYMKKRYNRAIKLK